MNSRRRFVKWAGLTLTIGMHGLQVQAATMPDAADADADAGRALHAVGKDMDYAFFDADDAAFIEAAVERLIPADEHGPGALHVGVSYYIDKQLCSPWGNGERRKRSDGWLSWLPGHEPAMAQSPAAFFRSALRGIETDLARQPEVVALRNRAHMARLALQPVPEGQPPLPTPQAGTVGTLAARHLYAYLPAHQQAFYLQLLKHGSRDLGAAPSQLFFETLLSMTIEGFFNAPVYSGNEEAVACRKRNRAAAGGAVLT